MTIHCLPPTSEQLWSSGSAALPSAPNLTGSQGSGMLLSAVNPSAPKASHPLGSLDGNQSLCNLFVGRIMKKKLVRTVYVTFSYCILIPKYPEEGQWDIFLNRETESREIDVSLPASLFFIVIRQRAWFVMSLRGVSPWSLVDRASTLKVCHESCKVNVKIKLGWGKKNKKKKLSYKHWK